MPYMVVKNGNKWEVHKQGIDKQPMGGVLGTHPSEAEAQAQMRALYANEKKELPEDGKLLIYKDATGKHRWVGIVSNKFRDNDRPREILSAKAHQDYVQWADENDAYPPLWIWHVPGSKVGQTDWLDYDGSFLLLSGTFDDDQVAERLVKSNREWTMSHGFVRLKHDPDTVVTDRYRMLEASLTPPKVEANPWTWFTAKEVSNVLSPKKKETLTQLLGAERVAEIEAGTKTMEDAAKAAGVDYKSIAEEEEEPTAEATKEVPSQEEQLGQLVDQLGLKELSTLIEGFQGTIAGLEQRIKTLEAATEEHKQSDDAKVAKALEPKAAKFLFAWQNAASKSQDTELKADDAKDAALKTAAPSANFFEQMVGSLAKGSDIS